MSVSSSQENEHEKMDVDCIEHYDYENVKECIEKNGLPGIEELFSEKLNEWKDVEINIGVTGGGGAGKSSFINAIRKLNDDDEGAAPTGPTVTTTEPTEYSHPENQKVKFWDLPAVGAVNYPAQEYWKKIDPCKFHGFLILASWSLNEDCQALARELRVLGKPFFLVRTHIDIDLSNEQRKRGYNEHTILEKIRKQCADSLKGLGSKVEDVFLISNHERNQWDFDHLEKRIFDHLRIYHIRETLISSLHKLSTISEDILRRKVCEFREKIPGTDALALDYKLLIEKINIYKEALGLPDENSKEYNSTTKEIQEKIRTFCPTSKVQIENLSSTFQTTGRQYTPYHFLCYCLEKMESTALEYLKNLIERLANDLPHWASSA